MSAPNASLPQERTGRALQLALFCAALAWSIAARYLSVSSAEGITHRLHADLFTPILGAFFFLFLLAVGYSLLEVIARRTSANSSILSLPPRPTAACEWALGAAIGWGIIVCTVLPMALAGALHVNVWMTFPAFSQLVVNLAVIALLSLAQEVIYRGYPFHRLIDATGPVVATILMSLLFAFARFVQNGAPRSAAFLAFVSGIVFSVAWLRTHALWLAWGMRFGWTASMGVLFGLPVSGSTDYSAVIQTATYGRLWLTGGDYGPEAALFLLAALIIGLVILIRVTRDFAWNYTHPPIVPGGYPMDVPPPKAHTAMEEAAQARPAPLVQILPSTPQSRSVEEPPRS